MRSLVEKMLAADVRIPRVANTDVAPYAAEDVRAALFERPLVYTVFDGDQELLCGLMRHAIMRAGMVPVNPPSILGYRDTVMRNQRKAEVLLEDIAFLNKCDQVWVFADIDAILKGSSRFPEGALFELLYAKHFRPHLPIFFVKPEFLLHNSVVPQPFEVGDIERLGEPRAIRELSALLGSNSNMPKVRYYFYDPLDFKYGEWLRCAKNVSSNSPLDPMLSVRLSDGEQSVGVVGQAWISMMRLADELCRVSSLHEQEGASHWSALVEFANRSFLGLPVHEISWADVGVPKALLGPRWPLTSRESEIVSARNKNSRLSA